MKLVFFFVSAFLILCERQAWITTTTTTTTTTTKPTTTTTTTTTTTKPTTTKPFTTTKPTTTKPFTTTSPTTTTRRTTTMTTHYPTTTAGPGVNLKGKMFTLSQSAGVTFFPPNYSQEPSTTTMSTTPKTTTTTTKPRTTTTTKPRTTTTTKPTTTTPKPRTTTTTTTTKPRTTTTTKPTTTTTTPPTTTTTTTKPRTTTTTKPTTTTTTPRTTTTTTKPPSTTTTTTKSTTTTWHTTTTAPVTRGVSVCLRFLADSSSINLFTLAPGSADALSLSLSNQWYTLRLNLRGYQISLNPRIPLWSPVRTQPWTSVCVVLDSLKNVVQVFQGESMSIRKIPVYRMVWSGEPVLKVSGFDGQVTDLEVWDSPLENTEIFRFMQNYGSSGTVLTWSNIAYTPNGNVLMEDTYSTFGQGQPISNSSEGEEQPIGSGQGRDQQRRHEKKFNERRQRKRQML